MESFLDSMSTFDTLGIASHFSQQMKVNSLFLVDMVVKSVLHQSLRSQISNIAKYEFQLKPAAAYSAMSSSIPARENDYRQSYTVEELYSLYLALTATPAKVLAMLEEPFMENAGEARVFLICNTTCAEACRFLLFTTGSSVVTSQSISVCFNTSSGLARAPVTHTCGRMLELSSTYVC